MTGRRVEVEERLESVRARVAAACQEAGRSPDDIILIVVTKFFPASDIRILHDLGVRDVGENRDQEARGKHDDPELQGLDLTWHFIGQLQTNKVGSVLGYADVIHTVDRPKLVRSLASHAAAAERPGAPLRVLVQVDLDSGSADTGASQGRGGAPVASVAELADAVAAANGLELSGIMAVAPVGADSDEAFSRLETVAGAIRATHPGATWVSAGMSGDLEAAIRHGATHLRVGSAILGSRPALR